MFVLQIPYLLNTYIFHACFFISYYYSFFFLFLFQIVHSLITNLKNPLFYSLQSSCLCNFSHSLSHLTLLTLTHSLCSLQDLLSLVQHLPRSLSLSLSPFLSLILHNHVYLLFLSLYDSGSDHVLPTRLSASMGEVTHSVSGTSTCREHSRDADADSLGPIPHWKVLGCVSPVRRLRKSILQASRACIRRWTC